MPTLPNITQGQMALDPVNQIIYYKTENNTLKGVTLKWLQENNTEIDTTDTVNVGGDFVITGNLTVNGTTTTLNTESILVEDNILILNSNVTASPSTNAGLEIERGTSENVVIRWNEGVDRWEFTDTNPSTGPWYPLVKTADDLSEGTTNLYFTDERAQDAINTALVAGTGVSKSYNDGLNTITVSIGQPVGITDTVTFNHVNANVTGQISDISNHGISDLSDVTITSPANGDFLRYSGSAWINDPVNLTTDTVGDYVSTISAGTGIAVSNLGGEGATPQISLNATLDDLLNVNLSSATPGQIMIYLDGQWVNSTFPTNEPMGHQNKNDSVISFNSSTREFSIAPSSTAHYIWCKGKRFTKTTTETTTIGSSSGLYYIYYDSEGMLQNKTTYFDFENETPVSYIYWNQTDSTAYFFADERHGVVLDWQTHEYLHRTRGAVIASGFGASYTQPFGDGSSDSHAQISFADGTFFDEDMQIDIVHSASPVTNTWQQRLEGNAYIPVFYRLNNHWKKDVATTFPFKQGSARAQYNLNTAGTWSTVDIDNNKYGVMFIVATNNLNEPVIAILGQEQFTDQGSAEATVWENLNVDGFPIFEFRPLFKVTFQTANAYTNTPHARITGVYDLRRLVSSDNSIPTTPVSDHGSMTGLGDDDHTQYFNSSRHDAHDHSTALNSASLNDLGDVTITSVATNQGLIWNGSAWVNSTIPLNLDGLSDVIITAATPNQVLKYDGTNWINAAAPGGSFAGTTYTTTVGDGSASTFVINHGLSTRNVVVSINENNSPYSNIQSTWEATTLNSITVYFASPPSSDSIVISVYAAVSGASTGNVNSYATTIGDGSALQYTITHNLSSRDIILQARNANSPYENYNIAWEATTINTATVYFDSAPASNSVRIKVIA